MAIWQPVVFVNSGIFHLCLNKIVIVVTEHQEVVEESTSALVTSEPYVVVDPEKADLRTECVFVDFFWRMPGPVV